MTTSQPQNPTRAASVDAYRGLVMFLLMAEVLHLARVSESLPDSKFLKVGSDAASRSDA